ncbi:MAG TPA: efflux RND transporter permease subunit, partial [Tepidisphaeraceae bacterium]
YIGRLFREFAVTLSVAIGVSLLVSLTTTPMMCAVLMRHRPHARHGRMYNFSERLFAGLISFYRWSLGQVLRVPSITLGVTLLTIGLTAYLYTIIPTGLFPQQDTGRLGAWIQADQDTSSQQMQGVLRQYVDIVGRDPAIAGFSAFTGGGGTNSGRMFMALKPLEERKVNVEAVIERLRTATENVPGAQIFFNPQQDLRVGGRNSNSSFQYTLQADNLDDLLTWAPKLTAKLKTVPGLLDVNSDQQTGGLQADVVIDRPTAARLGLSPQSIDAALYDAFGQRPVSTMYRQLNQYRVVMEATGDFTSGPSGLSDIYIKPSNGGAPVALSAVASYGVSNTPLSINHQGLFPAITISFNLDPAVALSDATNRIVDAGNEIGMPATIVGRFAGTAKTFQDSQSTQPLLIGAAIVAVYIVLGVLYESLIHPITILSTLPSAGLGALLALLLFGMELDLIATIGIILLIGIVKKNAIMMIDFALHLERSKDMSPRDAIFEACVLRFRPILMTTMAALLGGLPLAIGHGVGAELRRPLGIAIVGGLIVSQALTLYTTPVVYLYLDRLRLWTRSRFGRQPHGFPVQAVTR